MILWILVALSVVHTFLLIAIAGSVAKLVGYLKEESQIPVEASRETATESQLLDLPEGPLYRMENGELVQVGSPTYDQAVLRGEADPHADGLIERPETKNWDGIPVGDQ